MLPVPPIRPSSPLCMTRRPHPTHAQFEWTSIQSAPEGDRRRRAQAADGGAASTEGAAEEVVAETREAQETRLVVRAPWVGLAGHRA